MRILYLPIFESGSVHDTQFAQKRGLYTALAKAGHSVVEYDYLEAHQSYPEFDKVFSDLRALIEIFWPEMIISQFHGADILSPKEIRQLRNQCDTDFLWLNWSGDSWAHSLTAQPILDMAREFDLQLVAAPDALPVYEAAGIPAAYWNIAYEPPVLPLPQMPTYDVVFLANVINDKRRALMEFLKSLDVRVGIYGDWSEADGRNVYNFAEGEALYKNATVAIADNVYQDTQNYISNRPMQIMAAGGAICLHQRVPKMQELSGWKEGVHYLGWDNLDELKVLISPISHWTNKNYLPEIRKEIIYQAQEHVLTYHTWDERVRVLFEELLPSIKHKSMV